ncbi:MAG: LysR family transcriptional regulator [Verrucomicrobiaceae bacterium]|nr:LysR family transcriptional regulator [Verrucomicrobiaceae bacterium]
MTKKSSRASDALPRRYFKEVRFRQIRALVELSRQRSFAATAAAMGLAVPSVWQQVRALEDEFGVPLVIAQGPQITLTEDGKLLVELAAPLVEGFESLKAVFADRQKNALRTLRIVAPASMLHGALRKPVAAFRRKHPEVRLTLIDQPSFVARKWLEDGDADIGIIGIAPDDPPMAQFRTWLLARYPFHLITPADHPLAQIKHLTLNQIVKSPLVLAGESSSSHRQIRQIIEKAGLSPQLNVTTTATHRALLLDYVAIRLGVTICTSAADTKLPKPGPGECQLAQRDVSALFGHEEVFIVQRKGRHELAHVRAFREAVIAACKV